MYILKKDRRNKVTITKGGYRVDVDFFARYSNAEEIIKTNQDVAKYFTTKDGNEILVTDTEDGFEFTDESRSSNMTIKKALKALEDLDIEQSKLFLTGETRAGLQDAILAVYGDEGRDEENEEAPEEGLSEDELK